MQCSEALTENCEREWWENGRKFCCFFFCCILYLSRVLSSLSHIFIFPFPPSHHNHRRRRRLYNVITSTATRIRMLYAICLLTHSSYMLLLLRLTFFSFFQWSIEDSIVSRALDCVYLSHFTSFRAISCRFLFSHRVSLCVCCWICGIILLKEIHFGAKQSWVFKRLVHSPEAFSLSFSLLLKIFHSVLK